MKLTKIQYEILVELDTEWCKNFSSFEELNLTKKQLGAEFKILREAGLVEFNRGLIDDDGKVAGSGYCRVYGKDDEINNLLEEFEELNKKEVKE